MVIEENGIYIIKDEFFTRFNNVNLMENKSESRPHYYCIKDNVTGLFWVIPMSSNVKSYEKKIKQREKKNKRCDIFHIIKIGKRKSALIIGDIFPVATKYFKRAYTINDINCVIKNEKEIEIINKKAQRILSLIKRGIILHDKQIDVMGIQNELMKDDNIVYEMVASDRTK